MKMKSFYPPKPHVLDFREIHEKWIDDNIDGTIGNLSDNVHDQEWNIVHERVFEYVKTLRNREDAMDFANALEDYFDFSNPNFGWKAREIWSVLVNNTLPKLEY